MTALESEMMKRLELLTARVVKLEDACVFVKRYLVNLEKGTREDDPLRILRARFHAPLHAKLDEALAKPDGEAGRS